MQGAPPFSSSPGRHFILLKYLVRVLTVHRVFQALSSPGTPLTTIEVLIARRSHTTLGSSAASRIPILLLSAPVNNNYPRTLRWLCRDLPQRRQYISSWSSSTSGTIPDCDDSQQHTLHRAQ